MNKFFSKKNISNILFVIVLGIMLYPPSREWFMRQIAFAPSVNTEESIILASYNWNLKGLNTDNVDFSKLKGKIIFVNFWATWCPPCRAEMPIIQKLYNDYGDKIVFLFVTSEDWPTVETYFNKNGYNLPVYNSYSNPPILFTETNSIPATYLIDKKGVVLINKVGSADWNSDKVRKLIDSNLIN